VEGLLGAVDGALLVRLRTAIGEPVDYIDADEHVASVLRLLAHTPGSAKSVTTLLPMTASRVREAAAPTQSWSAA
jgi:hypothetical protein